MKKQRKIITSAARRKHDKKLVFRKSRRAMLLKYKTDRGCQRCREKHVACLEFHHRDESTKSFNVMTEGLVVALETLMAEITKCDVLCANCHKKLHYREKSGPWRTRDAVYDDEQGQWRGGRKDVWAKAREEQKKTRRPLSGIESGEDIADAIVPELLM